MIDWNDYPNFSKEEFDCQETGENEMQPYFLTALQTLRNRFGKPMKITSGYRSPSHSIETKKEKPGSHSQGIAADIAVFGEDRYELLKLAFELGFSGIGVHKSFIHLDLRDNKTSWGY